MVTTKYLTFILKGQPYGVPIGAVREINRMTEITSVPQTQEFVAGVMNLRGKVIPVIDLRMKFGMERTQQTKQTCIIVIEGPSEQVGMIVDSVSGVVDLNESQIEPRPTLGNDEKLSYVLGMGKVDNSVVILVDIVKALSKEELTKIYSTIESKALAS